MIINKIRIKNFYSYKDQEIILDKYKNELVVIKGKNGSGKSTIFEAIIWGLFGKTIRKSTEEAIVNSRSNKHCEIELTLQDNKVRILRGKKPGKLVFEVNGEVLTKDTATATQKIINDYFNIDYKTYMASMVFGQHSEVDFLNVSADDKRTIIRNFLALDDIFALRDLIRKFKSDYSTITKTSDSAIRELDSLFTQIKTQLEKIEKDKENSIFDNSMSAISIEEVLEKEKVFNSIKSAILSNEIMLASVDCEIKDLEDIVSSMDHPIRSTCKSCGSIKVKSFTPKEKKEVKTKLKNKEKEVSILLKECASLKDKLTKPLISSKDLNEFYEFKQNVSKQEFLLEQKTEILNKIKVLNKEKTDSVSNYNIMRFWEKAFSEQGLIKYVIKGILPFFNSKCNYYLSYLTKGNFIIEFDESLEEAITIAGTEVKYYSLSGGEKRKIQFAVLLGLKSLLSFTGREESKLLFVDEVAENLDQEGLTGLWDLLQELKKTKTIFLITHDKYLKTLFDSCKRISVVKNNNISKII